MLPAPSPDGGSSRGRAKLRPLLGTQRKKGLELVSQIPDVSSSETGEVAVLIRVLVFEALCEYGFRRNLWGLKPWGISASTIGFVTNAGVVLTHTACGFAASLPILLAAGALSGLALLVWIVRVDPDWVKTTAFAYADRLLAASEQL